MQVLAESSRPRRGVRRDQTQLVVGVVAALSALVAAFAPAAPTGLVVWDAVLKAVIAALMVLAASKAPRWVAMVVGGVAAGFAGLTLWAIAGWVSLGLAVSAATFRRRSRILSAVAAGLVVQVYLRLPAFGFFGLPSILAGLGFALSLVWGYRYGTRQARRVARWAFVGVGLVAMIVALVGAISLVDARADVDRGVAAAQRGLDAARVGDATLVAEELAQAESALGAAKDKVTSPTARLLRLVPVAAQHQRAIESATEAGEQVARDAAAAFRDADISTISLQLGSVDLVALQNMAPRLRSTVTSLEAALDSLTSADSPWLLPMVANRMDRLGTEFAELLPEVQLGAQAAEVVPGLLGAEQPQSYFVIFGTPAESREFGGFVGSWAVVTFDGGRIRLGQSGRINELYEAARASTVAPGTVSAWFLEMARPTEFPQNLTSSPDFAQVADISRQVLGSAIDEPLAGFVYLDAWAVADLLELAGPVEIPFQAEPLTSANAADFFFVDQYKLEDVTRDEIFDSLAVVARAVVGRISERNLPGPEELGRVLGPAARAGRLQVVTFNESHNDFLRSVKLLRDFGRDETTDFVALVQANSLSNKLDLYLERRLDYRAEISADGAISATATATLRSVVPGDAPEFTLGRLPTRGQNRVLLSLYSPLAAVGASANGVPVDVRSSGEFDLFRHLVEVTLPPTGEEFVVEFDLVGSLPSVPYSLEVWHQPLVNTDQVTVEVMTGDGVIEWAGPLIENKILEIGAGSAS